ncbi:hypothetical protein [Streptomyces sp. NPDC001415]
MPRLSDHETEQSQEFILVMRPHRHLVHERDGRSRLRLTKVDQQGNLAFDPRIDGMYGSDERELLAALLAALVWSTITAKRWHEAKDHAQRAAAAHQALQHLQAAGDQAATPVLAELEIFNGVGYVGS